MTNKIVHESGKRKMAVARTTIKDGGGNVEVNSIPLDLFEPELAREKIKAPLTIASEYVDLNSIIISSKSHGGGIIGQADAIASSIARALVEYSDDDKLLEAYLNYDRTLIAGDHRQKETRKPGQSSKGARHKRQKSYR
jgi:small subunit ribosomal protein S9